MTIFIGVSSVSAANNVTITDSMSLETIQSAIENANVFDNIIFESGIYNQILNLNITKNLNIIAKTGVNIVGKGTGNAFNILSNTTSFTLSGFNISNYTNGIYGRLVNLDGANITDNIINVTTNGIYIYNDNAGNSVVGANNSNFSNNTITTNTQYSRGIILSGGNYTNNTISDNNIINNGSVNSDGSVAGISISNLADGDIIGNNISNNYIDSNNGAGVSISNGKSNGFIKDNTISHNTIKNKANNRNGISLVTSANKNGSIINNKITNNNIESRGTAIVVSGQKESSNNDISKNNIRIKSGNAYNNSGGIYMTNTPDTVVKGNKIYSNNIKFDTNNSGNLYTTAGIWIINGKLVETNEIYNNIISSSDANDNNAGILIYDSTKYINNKIYNNDISNLYYGIRTWLTDDLNISSNNITNNNIGIYLHGNNNKVLSNNLLNNVVGIWVDGNANYSTINYNRIYKNSEFGLINEGNNTNANLNWWGKNIIDSFINDTSVGKSLTLDNWYVIAISVNDYITTKTGENAYFVEGTPVSIDIYLILNQLVEHYKMLLPYFEIDSFGVNIFNSGDTRLTILSEYFTNGKAGDKHIISSLADDEFVDFTIEFIKAYSPPFSPNGTETNTTNTTNETDGDKSDQKENNSNDSSKTLTIDPKNSKDAVSSSSLDNPTASAAMKNTGIPVAIVLAILFAIFSVVSIRKRK